MAVRTITKNIMRMPGTLGGEPIIVGHRIPVRAIVEISQSGYSIEEIATELFPQLSVEQVTDALQFYADNREEVDREIEENHIPDELIHPLVRGALREP